MITFRRAVREQTPLLIGLGGPSGSGKTATALKLARGILGSDEGIFFVDTEAGRAKHYACAPGEQPGPFKFAFEHCDLDAPFSPDRYAEAIAAAVKAGAEVVIIDSMSHAHEGAGGLLESHERELERMAGQDYQKRERVKFSAWIGPKRAQNQFVNEILQKRVHLIFAFRAKDKLELRKREGGKTEPVSVGWTPICSDRFEYEMTSLLMLPPNAKGVPDLAAPSTKINEHHKAFFPAGQAIDEQAGAQLAAWAKGGAPASAPVTAPVTPAADQLGGPTAGEAFQSVKRLAVKRNVTAARWTILWTRHVGQGIAEDAATVDQLTALRDAIEGAAA